MVRAHLVHVVAFGHMRNLAGHVLLGPAINFAQFSCHGSSIDSVRALSLVHNALASG
jgi:hypothetical protein